MAPEDIYPVRWAGRQAMVALPEHIDVSNARQIREELLSVINRGADALIVDMTATISCDRAGADSVARAYQRAVVSRTELRLVVISGVVLRMLGMTGVGRLVPVYPSVEAALVARSPAASAAVTSTDVSKTGGSDGVALANGEGALVLASRHLEEMFGYQPTELTGQPLERLIPAHLQAARARPVGTGALLTGLHQDGTTFPVEISLSPVQTTTGRFSLAVVRDMTAVRGLADVDAAAAGAQQAHRCRELLDIIVTSLYQVGVSLQRAADLPRDTARLRIEDALRTLDDTIGQIRDSTFAGTEAPGPSVEPSP